MAEHSDAHAEGAHHHNYVAIWAVLLVLLVISVLGPLLGHPLLTLVTAFGIAVIKAYLVVSYFMHLKIEKRYVAYLLGTAVVFMGILFAGVSPDVMKHDGQQWENQAAKAEVQRVMSTHTEAKH